jgi:hypothetical protein
MDSIKKMNLKNNFLKNEIYKIVLLEIRYKELN